MHALVTGAAGFIGSTLAARLLELGHQVRAVDSLTPYYDIALKQGNRQRVEAAGKADFRVLDLRTTDLAPLLDGVDVVFHQAGQPGVRDSWASGFDAYVEHNILVTQRLLESCRERSLKRFVFASSSSVYGNADRYPVVESDVPAPESPYGVTKLAAEHLTMLYASNYGVPAVALRYFTVYGPRQRPDMAIQRLVQAAVLGTPFTLFGSGEQRRDFTFVDDVVQANLAAADAGPHVVGRSYNIAGGSSASMLEVIDALSSMSSAPLNVQAGAPQAGDVARTGGDASRAQDDFGWHPAVDLDTGLWKQLRWQQEHAERPGPLR